MEHQGNVFSKPSINDVKGSGYTFDLHPSHDLESMKGFTTRVTFEEVFAPRLSLPSVTGSGFLTELEIKHDDDSSSLQPV